MNSSQFYHHPSDIIIISDGVDSIKLALQEFLEYESSYSLPLPNISRLYIPDVRHSLSDGHNQTGGVMPWPEGDHYIANIQSYINQHNNKPITLEQAKIDKCLAIDNIAFSKIAGGILLFNTTMPSNGVNPNALISYNSGVSLPSGFYIKDINKHQVILTLEKLNALNNAIVQLHYLCDKNADILKQQVNDLTTIDAINTFDININWPEVPYTPTTG